MRRYTLTAAVMLCATGSASAASWAEEMFGTLKHDFGAIPRGLTNSYSFQVRNTTGGPVRITSVRVSCGCLSARAAKPELAAGEESAVFVQLDSRRAVKDFHKAVFVQFEGPAFAEVRLDIRANVRDDLVVLPDALAFGRIKQGAAAKDASVTVLLTGTGNWKIQKAKSDSAYVQADVRPSKTGTGEYVVNAHLRPDLPVGTWYSTIWVTTDNPSVPRFPIPVTVEVTSR